MSTGTFRKRIDAAANYSAIFVDNKTIRIPLDRTKPITELRFPEFLDISPGTLCTGGCSFCYAGASKKGVHYTRLAEKVQEFFGRMSPEQRPFQVAIGGEQEPLENPEFWDMVEAFRSLGIVPNYTTNGMFVDAETVEKTKRLVGGVAVTLHPHLQKYWRAALKLFGDAGVKLNIHVIISDAESIAAVEKLYAEYAQNGAVEYFVLLPYMAYGHAKNNPKSIDYAVFEKWVDSVYAEGKLAFGANFYNFLKKHAAKYTVSMYPPEIFSAYLQMNDSMVMTNNSFQKIPVGFTHENGRELGYARTEFLTL